MSRIRRRAHPDPGVTGPYSVIIASSSAQKYWDNLPVSERTRIRSALISQPKTDPLNPRARAHLKAGYHCKREFKDLPDGHRILYEVDETERVVRILYGGTHDQAGRRMKR
jgi:mRNA-degrading endonuclease RelE of RelBE toxin-antitoxin system